ncbi:hypothetical protein N431DRAFT_430503 [Stipitochalara longipes BDJ]|nr:hypothetical protein N431DRAFT_430503 [Stipitochalara longipes BDJ]
MSIFKWIDECSKEEKSTTTFLNYYYPGRENVRPTATMQCWKDLDSHFCSSTYWQRTWIVQEVIMGPRLKIQHGQWTTNWDGLTFLEWGLSLFPNNPLIRKIENSVTFKLQEQRRLRVLGFGGSFESLLNLTKTSLCGDPRDAVYSLLNIARDCTMSADYSKSLSEVYETTLVAIKMSPETVIPLSQLLQECIGERISIPLWILRKDADKVRRIRIRTEPTFRVPCTIGSFARCEYVGQPWKDNPAIQTWRASRVRGFVRMTDLELSRRLIQMATKHEKWAQSHEQSGGHGKTSKSLASESNQQVEKDMLRRVKAASNGDSWAPECIKALRNFFVFMTEVGTVGLAPRSAKAGDYVCSFEGSKSTALVHNGDLYSPYTIRLPKNGETYGMIVSETRHWIWDIFPKSHDGYRLGHDECFVKLDLASLQTLTQPGRPVME